MLPFVRKSGGGPSPAGADPIGQMLYLMNREPEIMRGDALDDGAGRLPHDALHRRRVRDARVTSRELADRQSRTVTRYEYDEQLVKIVGIDPKCPPAVAADRQRRGNGHAWTSPRVSGSATDTVVITGIPDLHAAAIGSGGTRLYETHVALSTTSWISCPVPKKKTDTVHSIAAMPGLTNDSYLIIDNQETGAKSLEWLRASWRAAVSRMRYDEMTALAATSPPGANGVLFTPWLAGERSPIGNKHLRGGFTNLALDDDDAPTSFARSSKASPPTARGCSRTSRSSPGANSRRCVCWAAARSRSEWCQIYADALGRDVEQVPQPMVAQLRGAALLAAVGLGRHRLEDIARTSPSRARPSRRTRRTPRCTALDAEQFPTLYSRDKKWSRHVS